MLIGENLKLYERFRASCGYPWMSRWGRWSELLSKCFQSRCFAVIISKQASFSRKNIESIIESRQNRHRNDLAQTTADDKTLSTKQLIKEFVVTQWDKIKSSYTPRSNANPQYLSLTMTLAYFMRKNKGK